MQSSHAKLVTYWDILHAVRNSILKQTCLEFAHYIDLYARTPSGLFRGEVSWADEAVRLTPLAVSGPPAMLAPPVMLAAPKTRVLFAVAWLPRGCREHSFWLRCRKKAPSAPRGRQGLWHSTSSSHQDGSKKRTERKKDRHFSCFLSSHLACPFQRLAPLPLPHWP
jgi:hypothetical protein